MIGKSCEIKACLNVDNEPMFLVCIKCAMQELAKNLT